MSSSYRWNDFMNACKAGTSVQVLRTAENGAREHFKLTSKSATLKFIGDGGVHGLVFDKTVPWKNNPNKKTPIMVDSYNFFAGSDYGYLAFMFQPLTNMWLLKSFKKNERPDPRDTVIGDAFRKALQALKEEK